MVIIIITVTDKAKSMMVTPPDPLPLRETKAYENTIPQHNAKLSMRALCYPGLGNWMLPRAIEHKIEYKIEYEGESP